MSGDKVHHAPLPADMLAQLREVAVAEGCNLGGAFPGVGATALSRALAGQPVRAATRLLIGQGLERLAVKAMTAFNRASVPGDGRRL